MNTPSNQPSSSWLPGDVVLDGEGCIRVRTDDPHWVWEFPDSGYTRPPLGGVVEPGGSLVEHEITRPLTLLVRNGHAVGGQVVIEVPPQTSDVGPGFVFMMAGNAYRVIEPSGDQWECAAITGATTRMSAADIARRKGMEYPRD